MHYVSVHVYGRFCVPLSPMGFLLSPFMIPTPHCKALRWIMHHGAGSIECGWCDLARALIAVMTSSVLLRSVHCAAVAP